MRTLRHIILLSIILPALSGAETAPMTLAWDSDAPTCEVWRGLDKLASVTGQEAVLQLPVDALSTLVVIAIYPDGQRLASEPLTVQPVRVQISRNLAAWDPHPWFFLPYSTSLFLRAEFVK